MENNLPSMESQITKPLTTSVSNGVKAFCLLLILAVITPLVYTNYILRIRLKEYTSQKPTPTQTPTITQSPSPTATVAPSLTITMSPTVAPVEQWQTAKHGGVFSYSYPSGWHVAELWPEVSGGPIRLAMDPSPITTAPMGGPSSKFNINFYNGLPKPDTKLSELKSQFNPQDYTDIKTETIDSVNGPIFYHSGKMSGEYMNGTKVENYIFTVKKSTSDPYNVQVMQATLYSGDQKLSEMFRHVVLSFRSL